MKPSTPAAFVLFALLVAASAGAGAQGLNNGTKHFTEPQAMTEADWTDPAEMDRAWRAAIVRLPRPGGGSTSNSLAELAALNDEERRLPTIIHLHGCGGIWYGTHQRMTFLANAGFLVIAPASFAREKYPRSCDENNHRGGLYRGILRIRQQDAGHAIERARALSIVDPDNIFLMGHSEGGIAAATFRPANPRQRVKARVVEGWTCHAGWLEYLGIAAGEQEPVLTLVGGQDPWYQNRWTRGDCTSFIEPGNGSRSIVYRDPPLASEHNLLSHRSPQQEVLRFLKAQLNR